MPNEMKANKYEIFNPMARYFPINVYLLAINSEQANDPTLTVQFAHSNPRRFKQLSA